MLTVYSYKSCSTCRNAANWLKSQGIRFQECPIRETPPSLHELKLMLDSQNGDVKKLFNTSGQDYREMKLKDVLPTLSLEESLQLLHKNGNLVKRPFLIDEKAQIFHVGFRQDAWGKSLGRT